MTFSNSFLYRDCPWCSTRKVAMRLLADPKRLQTADGKVREWTFLACPNCAGGVLVETMPSVEGELREVPEHKSEVDVAHLPDEVERPYRNAITVLGAGVPSSAAVELRRTLEAAALSQGVKATPLVKAVEELAEKGYITKSFTPVLGHIRKIGNVGAHAGEQEVTVEEAQLALRFTTQILRNLFEIPAELAALTSLDT